MSELRDLKVVVTGGGSGLGLTTARRMAAHGARVSSAMKAIKGEDVPKVIDTGFYWYDKTNIEDPKIKAVLYE